MRLLQTNILLIFILAITSCCPYDDYLGYTYVKSDKDFRNVLRCNDTSSRILSIHYPTINRKDTGINANSTTILLPTNSMADIIVTTTKKKDTIRVLSTLSIKLENSDYLCGNDYITNNKYSITFTTADSVKIFDYDYTSSLYNNTRGSFGYIVLLFQN